eukprot:1410780-Prymnesium_polylepis.1
MGHTITWMSTSSGRKLSFLKRRGTYTRALEKDGVRRTLSPMINAYATWLSLRDAQFTRRRAMGAVRASLRAALTARLSRAW